MIKEPVIFRDDYEWEAFHNEGILPEPDPEPVEQKDLPLKTTYKIMLLAPLIAVLVVCSILVSGG